MRVIIEPDDSDEKRKLAEALKANGLVLIELEKITPIETSVELRFKKAIMALQNEGLIKHKYDYAWLYAAIQIGVVDGMSIFASVNSFIIYVTDLGIEGVAAISTLSQYYSYVQGKFPDWSFTDTLDMREKTRRVNLVKRFLKLFNT